MFQHNSDYEHAYQIRRFDDSNPLSSVSAHPIVLEDENWITAEHYVSARIVASSSLAKQISDCSSGERAAAMAKPWYRKKVANWKQLRKVLMTRAIYTKVQMYEEVRQALLETGEQLIVETSAYDHFWGIGRDQRGDNTYGKVLMDIRSKIIQENA
jgi:ribA/ribD-fused uncharacterized protein